MTFKRGLGHVGNGKGERDGWLKIKLSNHPSSVSYRLLSVTNIVQIFKYSYMFKYSSIVHCSSATETTSYTVLPSLRTQIRTRRENSPFGVVSLYYNSIFLVCIVRCLRPVDRTIAKIKCTLPPHFKGRITTIM